MPDPEKKRPILRVVVCEDNVEERAMLLKFLDRVEDVKVIGKFENGRTALESLPELAPDVLLLDISMPGASGIEIAEILEERKRLPYTVFITGDDKFALKAFDLGAVDYILKPLNFQRLQKALDRAREKILPEAGAKKYAPDGDYYFRHKDKHYLVPYAKIIYVESSGRNTRLHTTDTTYDLSLLLKKVEEKLPSDIFFRIHKQYVVNIEFISHLQYNASGSYFAYIKDSDKVLPVSSKNAPGIKKFFQNS